MPQVLTVIAGPNGSGKSTLTEMLVRQGMIFGRYLNADDIARDLSGPPDEVSRQAQQIVREERDLALRTGQDHAFETVMSHRSHIDYMIRAASFGFQVRLIFVATEDPVLNVGRVANRMVHGGHYVPTDRIIARYHRCLDNLPAAIKSADVCAIYDNSSAGVPARQVAAISKNLGASELKHIDRPGKTEMALRLALPVWWLEILLRIKSDDPFADGPLT